MGLLARIKTWVTNEEITASDLNAEFDNIVNNMDPGNIGDLSPDTIEFKKVKDPGNLGSENLPSTLEEEVQELRSMIKKITGKTEWYIPPSASIDTLLPTVVASLPLNRVVSGLVDSDRQPQFLVADNTTLNLQFKGLTTPLTYIVSGQEFTNNTDDTLAVATGPSTGNTALVDDTINTGEVTKYLGEEDGTKIKLKSVGIQFSAGSRKAFKTTNGGNTEYFIADTINEGGTTYIVNAMRGFFFDSTGSNERVQLADGQTITALRLSHIFMKNDGTLLYNTTNKSPYIGSATPTGAISGDWWFDVANQVWKLFDGAVWNDSDSTFIGLSVQGVGKVEATRSVEFYKQQSDLCDLNLVKFSDDTLTNHKMGGKVSVNGVSADFYTTKINWGMGFSLDSGVVESADTRYYFYLTDEFEAKISDIKPHDRQMDLRGWYHPSKPWRCIGYADNDSSSNLGYPVTYGSDTYLSDNSLRNNKLANYKLLDDSTSAIFQNSMARKLVTNHTTATAIELPSIITTGRPVLIVFIPYHLDPTSVGRLNVTAPISGGQIKFSVEKRTIPNTAWADVKAGYVMSAAGFDISNDYPFPLMFIDVPQASQVQYRLVPSIVAGSFNISGEFYAIEL